jgi:hypothetical protein
LPLLCCRLNATYAEAIPQATLQQLRSYFHANAQRNLRLTGELLTLLRLFATHDISAIPFKGPVLAAAFYGNLALRQFDDLDILVHRQDVLRAKNLLFSQGYRPYYWLTPVQETAALRALCELNFQRDADGSVIDLHWNFTSRFFPFARNAECLWERRVPVFVGGQEILTFAAEDLLLILCVHSAKHLWERMGWVCDIAQLISTQKEINWERVMQQAEVLRGERILALGLFLASELMGAVLPPDILRKVQADPAVHSLATEVCQRFFQESDSSPRVLDRRLFQLRVRERLKDKVRYCWYWATTPTVNDWAWIDLPPSLFGLYSILRPIRVAGKYGRRLFLGRG